MNMEDLVNMKYIDLRRLAKNLGLQNIGKKEVLIKIIQDYYEQQDKTPNKKGINKENNEPVAQTVAKLPQDEEIKLANAFNSTVLIETSNKNKITRQQVSKQTPKTPANRIGKIKQTTKTVNKAKELEDKKPQTPQVTLNEQSQDQPLNENRNLASLDTTFDINKLTNSTPILNNKPVLSLNKKQNNLNETFKAAENNASPNTTKIFKTQTPKTEFKPATKVTQNIIEAIDNNTDYKQEEKKAVIDEQAVTKSKLISDQNDDQTKKPANGPRIVRPKDQNGNEIFQVKAGPRIIKPGGAQTTTAVSKPIKPSENDLITDDESEEESYHEAPVLRPPKKGVQTGSNIPTNVPKIVKPSSVTSTSADNDKIPTQTQKEAAIKLVKSKSIIKEKPNFKAIHEKNSQNMESIDDHKKRIIKRHESMQNKAKKDGETEPVAATTIQPSPVLKTKISSKKETSSPVAPKIHKPIIPKTPQTPSSPARYKFDNSMLTQNNFNFNAQNQQQQQGATQQKERQSRPQSKVITIKRDESSTNTTLAPVVNTFIRRKSYDPNASLLKPLNYNPYKGKIKTTYYTGSNLNGSILGSNTSILNSQPTSTLNTTVQQQSKRLSSCHISVKQLDLEKKEQCKKNEKLLKQNEGKKSKRLNALQKSRPIDASIMQE